MDSVMLYFGSFNPVHKGHLAVAEWVLAQGICDRVWFVVSPHNPLKEERTLMSGEHRLAMVSLAVGESPYADRMKVCDVEFTLPRPSYTIETLSVLDMLYPGIEFSVLVGSDIPAQIVKWKDWRKLLNNYKIYVYPRRGYPTAGADPGFVILENAPYEDCSSTEIRNTIADGSESGMLAEAVKEYMNLHHLWKTKEI